MEKTLHHLARALAGLLLAATAGVHAAAPTAGTTQQQIGAGQPPAISNFRIDGGAPIAYDLTLGLTWTTVGQATQWRVEQASNIQSAPWQALPAGQPWKFSLPSGAQDGQKSIAMQLRNEQGQSPIANATIEFRRAPKITSATITAASASGTGSAQIKLSYGGKITRWAVNKSAQPPFTDAGWNTLTAAAAAPISPLFEMEQTQMADDRVTGRTVAAWVHVQRDASPIDSQAVSFVYIGPNRSWSFDEPWETSSFVERLGARNRISAQRLSPVGVCAIQHLKQMAGPYAQGVQGFYAVAGKDPMTTPVVCRFNVFDGKALAPGWVLKYVSAGESCRVLSTTLGASPSLVLEVTLPADPMPTAFAKAIGCNLAVVQLDGPWSIGEIGLGAIP